MAGGLQISSANRKSANVWTLKKGLDYSGTSANVTICGFAEQIFSGLTTSANTSFLSLSK
jgi:hypothetical protein